RENHALPFVMSRNAVTRSRRLAGLLSSVPPTVLPDTIQYKGDPRVVARYPCCVRAGADRQSAPQHVSNGRRIRGRGAPVPFDEICALIGHAMLHGDAAAERGDAIHILAADRFCVVEKPA